MQAASALPGVAIRHRRHMTRCQHPAWAVSKTKQNSANAMPANSFNTINLQTTDCSMLTWVAEAAPGWGAAAAPGWAA